MRQSRSWPLRSRPTGEGRDTVTARSLADLAKAKVALRALCHRCKHTATLYPATLAEKLGADRPITDVRRKLKCSDCGARGGMIRLTEVER